MQKQTLLVSIIVAAFMLQPTPYVHAAPAYNVAPLVIDLEVQPRDILSKTITVTNTGTQPVTLYPTVNNIAVDEGGSIEKFISPAMSDRSVNPSSWVEVNRGGKNLPLGESIEITITFRINLNAEPGTYHVLVAFGYGRTRIDAEKMVKDGRAPGTVITFSINENKSEFMRLSRFIIDKFVTRSDNGAITYKVNNPGDLKLAPQGDIIFYNSRGEEVASVPVNPEKKELTPGAEETFTTSVPTDGLLGKYKAYLTVEYGTEQLASVNDTTYFYVLPWKKLLVILLLVLVAVTLLSLYVHKRYLDDGSDDDEGTAEIPVGVRSTASEPKKHDIDLKNT